MDNGDSYGRGKENMHGRSMRFKYAVYCYALFGV